MKASSEMEKGIETGLRVHVDLAGQPGSVP